MVAKVLRHKQMARPLMGKRCCTKSRANMAKRGVSCDSIKRYLPFAVRPTAQALLTKMKGGDLMRRKGACGGKRRKDGSGKGKGNYGTAKQPKTKK